MPVLYVKNAGAVHRDRTSFWDNMNIRGTRLYMWGIRRRAHQICFVSPLLITVTCASAGTTSDDLSPGADAAADCELASSSAVSPTSESARGD